MKQNKETRKKKKWAVAVIPRDVEEKLFFEFFLSVFHRFLALIESIFVKYARGIVFY